MNVFERPGHWAVPTLCAYAGMNTMNRNLQRIVMDPAESAQFSQTLPWLAALIVLYMVAGWGVYRWLRWAPWVTAAVFGRYIYSVMSAQGMQPRALVEASLFAAACLWFLLADVRLRFRHGKWI
jgi:hypothetical protein